ncbi:MAG: NAD(P)/FAD-dependent oxidoreductase [Paracoccaceae bacterium]|nr:NAD(P)/FAD-dependent oxidoreductase [Paracoccaceae bacterium]MDE2739571.1 NAD(P)/FAD-dependent oxidoreductase [Paracoccaceae bacterium]
MKHAADWLSDFVEIVATGNGTNISELFVEGGFWRDYLSFGWSLQTIEGREAIAKFGSDYGAITSFKAVQFEGKPDRNEGFFRFQTGDGLGRGYLNVEDGLCTTLFTMLNDLPHKSDKGTKETSPYVLVVGGGQAGLALGAQLQELRVPYLIIDKYPHVGDQWRLRYDSLVLHDPIWYNHMPFKPFPKSWPVFTPKDMMGNWLKDYAEELSLNIWTGSTLIGAHYDGKQGNWHTKICKEGETQILKPTHLVMALGLSGFPKVPKFEGQETFAGNQLHSSEYKSGREFANKTVVIVGANNSAHDIASDLAMNGSHPIMIQRSSTLVVNQQDYCERILGSLYSAKAVARGISVDKADILQASVPLRLLESRHRAIWDSIRRDRQSFYQRLIDAGFTLDFAEDGTGLGMKYRRTASGYYIDVGGSEMVIEGSIEIRSGHGIDHLSKHAIHLTSGEEIETETVIYATGYGNMSDWIAALIDDDTARRVGPCWGYGSGTKGDPGPWLGELRNMWVETAQTGLWMTGGNLSQARFFSRLLALQLAKRWILSD